jgi:hypothetical protein
MTTSAVFPHTAHCTSPLTIAISITLALLVIAGFAIAKRIADRREARRWAEARAHIARMTAMRDSDRTA